MSDPVQRWQIIEIPGEPPVEYLRVPGGTLYRQIYIAQSGSKLNGYPTINTTFSYMTWTIPTVGHPAPVALNPTDLPEVSKKEAR